MEARQLADGQVQGKDEFIYILVSWARLVTKTVTTDLKQTQPL